jgi:hypothetical protein
MIFAGLPPRYRPPIPHYCAGRSSDFAFNKPQGCAAHRSEQRKFPARVSLMHCFQG